MTRFSETIFISRSGLLGDTLVAVPSLVAIREAYPTAHLVYVGEVVPGKKFISPKDVLGGTGLINEFLYFHSGGFRWTGFKSLLLLAWETLRRRPALVIILEAPGRYSRKALFFRLLGCTVVPAKSKFFTYTPLQAKQNHELVAPISEQLLQVVENILERRLSPVKFSTGLPLRAEDAPVVQDWIIRNGGKEKRLVGLGIWSNMPSKRWPLDRYREVICRLQASDPQIFPVILGAREERLQGQELVRTWKSGAVAAGELSIHQSAHLLARSKLYVGNDTGIMHLAAAVGTPCVAIFSARDQPGKWHPIGRKNEVLRKNPPCSGCLLRECKEHQLRCLTDISVEEVFVACVGLLGLSQN